ncbi:hypothetical protein SAMN02927923_04284 [Microvirga guangxiensis]|uniref:Uncharacterized protein n=1 Tax=Microvirga guangxiensis TaxID=549386 RepID=A0A1G5LIF7_9HYPH|nr:hypothetical protein SAMN02927923_04284 [Microvirga guangxiensis]
MQDTIANHPSGTTTPWNQGKLIGPRSLIASRIWPCLTSPSTVSGEPVTSLRPRR